MVELLWRLEFGPTKASMAAFAAVLHPLRAGSAIKPAFFQNSGRQDLDESQYPSAPLLLRLSEQA